MAEIFFLEKETLSSHMILSWSRLLLYINFESQNNIAYHILNLIFKALFK